MEPFQIPITNFFLIPREILTVRTTKARVTPGQKRPMEPFQIPISNLFLIPRETLKVRSTEASLSGSEMTRGTVPNSNRESHLSILILPRSFYIETTQSRGSFQVPSTAVSKFKHDGSSTPRYLSPVREVSGSVETGKRSFLEFDALGRLSIETLSFLYSQPNEN